MDEPLESTAPRSSDLLPDLRDVLSRLSVEFFPFSSADVRPFESVALVTSPPDDGVRVSLPFVLDALLLDFFTLAFFDFLVSFLSFLGAFSSVC